MDHRNYCNTCTSYIILSTTMKMVFTKFSRFSDLKILNGALALDNDTANALGYKSHQIEIYSNSWGPSDNGYLIHGPGRIVKHALKEGVNLVRLHYLMHIF